MAERLSTCQSGVRLRRIKRVKLGATKRREALVANILYKISSIKHTRREAVVMELDKQPNNKSSKVGISQWCNGEHVTWRPREVGKRGIKISSPNLAMNGM